MALFTALRQTLTSKISSFTSRFSSRNSRHRRLPSDPQSFQYQSPTETPNEQTRTPVSAIDMAPVGSAAPVTCHKPERKLFLLRALQLLCMLAFIPCIATASGYTGRWTYASIEATVALGYYTSYVDAVSALFVATTFMILVCYRVAPNQGHDHGIELARRVNPDATSSRGPNMPSTGLPRTG
ncbi:MAG: hypothetical protein LQ338_001836 [Usnochroma carphineum]|nr:MAG: hypothetical protein LQ338_001836 [Usnochroma carphineum]